MSASEEVYYENAEIGDNKETTETFHMLIVVREMKPQIHVKMHCNENITILQLLSSSFRTVVFYICYF